jgi:hypothetical protein
VFKQLWKTFCTLTLIIGVFLGFFAIVEILHAYEILANIHPILSYAFLLVLVCIVGYLFAYVALGIYSRPPVLVPPLIANTKTASLPQTKLYCKYLLNYIKRLAENENLPSEARQRCNEGQLRLIQASKSSTSRKTLVDALQKAEKEIIFSAMGSLDAKAEREIRNCVRDVMMGVMLSPYRAADLFVVIYKNAAMVVRIMRIYNSRPRVREQILIFRDTVRVVATVNFLNLGEKILETMAARMPFLGGFVDEMAQGVGAGILTSATGHAALSRCRAYRGWKHEDAVEGLQANIRNFVGDVKGLFGDLLLEMRSRIRTRVPTSEMDRPDFWESVTGGISSSIDAVGDTVESFVRLPSRATIGAVVEVGKQVFDRSLDLGKTAGKGIKSATQDVVEGGMKVLDHSFDLGKTAGEGFMSTTKDVAEGGREVLDRSLELGKTAGEGFVSATEAASEKLDSLITNIHSGSGWIGRQKKIEKEKQVKNQKRNAKGETKP